MHTKIKITPFQQPQLLYHYKPLFKFTQLHTHGNDVVTFTFIYINAHAHTHIYTLLDIFCTFFLHLKFILRNKNNNIKKKNSLYVNIVKFFFLD